MSFGHATVRFMSPVGPVLVQALVPKTFDERYQGLRGVRFLPADSGMLFGFDAQQSPVLTMQGVLLPLDMIFIRDQYVLSIIHAVPGTPRVVGPRGSQFVLEVGGGFARRHAMAPGQPVRVSLR